MVKCLVLLLYVLGFPLALSAFPDTGNDIAINAFEGSENSSLQSKCSEVTNQPFLEQCQFVKEHCKEQESIINYYRLYYCHFKFLNGFGFGLVPIGISLIILFFSLGITASDYLCPNLHTVSKVYLKIPDNLAGLTLLAFGNSSPDIFSTYQAIKIDSINLAVSELIGASLFVSSFVVGCIGVMKPFEIPRALFGTDVIMYLMVYLLITISLVSQQLKWPVCVALITIYIIYVTIAIYSHRMQKSRVQAVLRDQRLRGNYAEAGIRGGAGDGSGIGSGILNQQIDDIYLDRMARLPTIDDIDLGRENLFSDDMDNNDVNNIGNYGLKKLMKDLSTYSNLTGTIQLSDERPLSTDLSGNIHDDHDDHDDWSKLVSIICPELYNNFNEKVLLERVLIIVQLPIRILLKLSIPVRSFSKSSSDTETEPVDELFDYSSDRRLLIVQTFIGSTILVSSYTKLPFLISPIISAFISYACYYLYPPTIESSSSFAKRIEWINYFASFLGFFVPITWISIIASEIINILQVLSTVYNLSDDILGITLFAVGNSVGDFATNYAVARMGFPIMAFSACFGGPLLALCSLGLNGLIIGGDHLYLKITKPLSIGFLTLFWNMSVLCIGVSRNGWVLDRKIGSILIGNWVAGCLLCIASEYI
ncbi:hypothetical protein KGF56_002662 [Candida oxycetoniae]|uniref:Sodium/calcium exchanger membrane region domain-containing protein n=1 Tax=Candida oxycetoniae TaxID=497107 RepID=A0AAI9SX37_9ASCO|nr:uncharacterized protein KGF56_002662 [Candida oxycetoniae]KAI3404563.2 hypothetical protein KGF56_002662 [Candida oxycetoniae]